MRRIFDAITVLMGIAVMVAVAKVLWWILFVWAVL
jgi:hypothetical protein